MAPEVFRNVGRRLSYVPADSKYTAARIKGTALRVLVLPYAGEVAPSAPEGFTSYVPAIQHKRRIDPPYAF